MAFVPGRGPFNDRKSSSSLSFEEFVPPSAWTEDSTCHYLLVDLPGFKRHELKLQVDNQTRLVVSGERQVRENKYKRFEQSFELPKNADIGKITGKLDGEILYITVPKKVEQEHQEIKHGDTHGEKMDTSSPSPSSSPSPARVSDIDEDDNDNKLDTIENQDESDIKDGEQDLVKKKQRRGYEDNWGQDADFFLKLAIEKLKENKGIVVTAIFAFSLGILVTQKFQSNGN